MNIGKIVAIVVIAFVAFIAFGDKVMNLYKHQDDLGFNLNNITYTTDLYNAMDGSEQDALLFEIENLCVRKHYSDGLTCTDTSYWLANNLRDEGVDNDLVMNLMPTCTEACETQAAPPPVVTEEQVEKKKKKSTGRQKYGGATKWFWED